MKQLPISKVRGFSLIELMIAMLIGLIILNGVIQVVISSKRSYLDNQAMSQIQENSRFALDVLSREVRVAGYLACMPSDTGEVDVSITAGSTDFKQYFSSVNAIQAVEVLTDKNTFPAQIKDDVKEGTDVLLVRHTDVNNEFFLLKDLQIEPDLSGLGTGVLKKGQPVALVSSGCELANVFSWGSGAEPNGNFSKQNFKAGSRVSPVLVSAFYIGTSNVVNDMFALKREVILMNGETPETRAEELAMGVSDMKIDVLNLVDGDITIASSGVSEEPASDGADDGADASADDGAGADDEDAAANLPMANAVALSVKLKLRSYSKVNPTKTNGQGEITDDGYITQNATATVQIRNRG